MIAHASLCLLALALSAPPQCPNTGDTSFFDGGNGFQGFRQLGRDSYRSFFVGHSFRKATSDEPIPPGRVHFWVDRLLVQWQLVETRTFQAARASPDGDKLKAFLEYERGYLKTLAEQGKVSAGSVEVFDPLDEKGTDGKSRLFQIWQARMGKQGEATQFWVATPHPQGVVMLSVIAASQEDVGAAKALIDSYMGNYGPVDSTACERLGEEVSKGR